MPVSPRKSFGSTAFTLVELLVVVGIITLLVGILLPMLLKARRSVNGITCESNLRQWGIATTLYANENHGFLPRRGQGVGPTGIIDRPSDWFNALPQILRMPQYQDMVANGTVPRPPANSPWICPQASDMPGAYYWSYSMNMALSVWEADEFNGQPNTITGVGNTSIMVLFGDGPGNYCSIYPSITAGGYNPVPRHNNGTVNICFLDGHVSAIPGSYLGCGKGLPAHPDIVWLPPGSKWNSAQ